VTTGFDRLTDSATTHVAALRQSGVAVTHRHYRTVFHNFMSVRLFAQRREALGETREFFRELFGRDAS
jgi:acetyl esterase/lipase